eukprot:g6540.t1
MGTNTTLSFGGAACACVVYSCGFVGVLYMLPRRIRMLERDHPLHIRARSAALCAFCVVVVVAQAWLVAGGSIGGALRAMGVRADGGAIFSSLCCLMLSMALFIGPLAEAALRLHRLRWQSGTAGARIKAAEPLGWSTVLRQHSHAAELLSRDEGERWQALRDLVVGPATEEAVFRGAMCSALLAAGVSRGGVTLCSPLFFGPAHAHHAVARVRAGMAVRQALLIALMQWTYTSLFGAFAAFVFARSRRLLPVVLSHAFCNAMGLPELAFLDATHPAHRHKAALLAAYALGVAAFYSEATTCSHFPPMVAFARALLSLALLPTARALFVNSKNLTTPSAPKLEFYELVQADSLCLQGVTPPKCASAAHTVHGVGTHDGGYAATGTMTTPLANDSDNPDKPGQINQAGFVLKTDSKGKLLWTFTHDAPGYYDSILSVVEGPKDDSVPYALYAGGITWTAADWYDRVLVKIHPQTGKAIWRAVWADPKGVPNRDDSLATGDVCGAIEFVDMDRATGDLLLAGYVNGVKDMNTGELKSGGKPDLCHAFAGRLPKAALQGTDQAGAPKPADLAPGWDLYDLRPTFRAIKGDANHSSVVTGGAISGSSVRALDDGGAVLLTRVKFDGGDETVAVRLAADGSTAWSTAISQQVQAADIAGPPSGDWFVVTGFGAGPLHGIDGQWTRIDGDTGEAAWTRTYGYYVPGKRPFERNTYIGEECWGLQYVHDEHGEGVVTACGMGPESFNCPEPAKQNAMQKDACDGFGLEWRNFNIRLRPDGTRAWQTVDSYVSADGLRENGASEYIALTKDGGAVVFNDNDSGIGLVKIGKFGTPVDVKKMISDMATDTKKEWLDTAGIEHDECEEEHLGPLILQRVM